MHSKPNSNTLPRRIRLGLIACALAIFISSVCHFSAIFSGIERAIADSCLTFTNKLASEEHQLIAIDQESLFRLGGHPIGRNHIAQALDRLNLAGTNRIYLNMSFATAHNEEQDILLQNSLEQLGPERVALPVCLLQAAYDRSDDPNEKWLEPLPRFAKNILLVDGNTYFDRDGFVRTLGQPSSQNSKYSINIAQWLNGISDSTPEPTKIDYRIDLSTIPQT